MGLECSKKASAEVVVLRVNSIAIILKLVEYMEEYRDRTEDKTLQGLNRNRIKEEKAEKDTKIKHRHTKNTKCV